MHDPRREVEGQQFDKEPAAENVQRRRPSIAATARDEADRDHADQRDRYEPAGLIAEARTEDPDRTARAGERDRREPALAAGRSGGGTGGATTRRDGGGRMGRIPVPLEGVSRHVDTRAYERVGLCQGERDRG